MLERFERQALVSVIAWAVLEHALPAGLRLSLHAAAPWRLGLPVLPALLYEKVNHTKPVILRALVHGGTERLAPLMAAVGCDTGNLRLGSPPDWQARPLDSNHLPESKRQLAPLLEFRGGALPGQSVVVSIPIVGWAPTC